MDVLGWTAPGAAAVASGAAFVLAARGRRRWAVALVLVAAALLRANLACHFWLSEWDERSHALVARNLIEHPLVPTLIDEPLFDAPPDDWMRSQVWLHKPPGALWLMAGSMAVFGVGEIALRLPSLLFGTLAVWITYLLARRFVDETAALAAAAFHGWHGRSALLVGGLRATDHVDVVFLALVEIGVWVALAAAAAAARAWGRRALLGAAAAGLLLGLALLTKDAPALVILAVFGVALLQTASSWRQRVGLPALLVLAALVVFLPWRLYTMSAFPEASAYAQSISLSRFFEVAQGHEGSWTFHLARLPRYFGALVWIPLAAFVVEWWRSRRDWGPLVVWWIGTYAVFSAAATKMEGYVFVAMPVTFVACGWFCAGGLHGLGDTLRAGGAGRRLYAGAALAVAAAFVLGPGLRAQRPWDPRPRRVTWAEELRHLGDEVRALPGRRWVVFNAPARIEAMFYAPATAIPRFPERRLIEQARARGFRVAVYGSPGDPELAKLARDDRVQFLPPYAPARPLRRLALALRAQGVERARIYNARDPVDVEAYLERLVPCRVSSRWPDPADELERGARIVVLVGAKGPPKRLREGLPDAIFLAEPELARSGPP